MTTATDIPRAAITARRLRIGVSWSLVGTVCSQGSTFAVNLIIANLLGRQIFGQYAAVQSTLLAAAATAQMATGYTASKYVAQYRSRDPARAGRILGLCRLISLVTGMAAASAMFIASDWLAAQWLNAPHLGNGLRIASCVVLFAVNNSYQMGALAGLEGYRSLGKAGILSGMVCLIVCVAGAWQGSLAGALAGLAVSIACHSAILRWQLSREVARQQIVPRYRDAWHERVLITRFALPAAIAGAATMLTLWFANCFLLRRDDGYEQLALYSAANSFRIIVLFLPTIVNGVALSLLNHQRGVRDVDQGRYLVRLNLVITAVVTSLGAIGLAVVGPQALRAYGGQFSDGYPVLLVLLLSTLVEAGWHVLAGILVSAEKMWRLLCITILPREVCIVVLAWALTPTWGALGNATAYLAGWSCALVAMTFALRTGGGDPFWKGGRHEPV